MSVLTHAYLYSINISPIFIFLSSSILLISHSQYSSFLIIFLSFIPIPSSDPLIQSIRVGSSLCLFIFSSSSIPNFWPRMFYRSGWLRCDVVKCIGLCLSVWCSRFRLVFDVWCILYYILLYLILSSSNPLFLFPFLFLFFCSPHLFFPSPLPLPSIFFSHPNISFHSIRVGIWIHLFIFFQYSGQFDPACFIGVDGWGV